MNERTCFIYDFLDFCLASNLLDVEDGFYVYPEEDDINAYLQMQIERPRLTEYEKGWTNYWERSQKVVPLVTIRETSEQINMSK